MRASHTLNPCVGVPTG